MATANLVMGMFVGIVTFTVLVTLLALTIGLILLLPMAVVTGALLLVSSRLFGRFERFRYRTLLDLPIARPHRPVTADGLVAPPEVGACCPAPPGRRWATACCSCRSAC